MYFQKKRCIAMLLAGALSVSLLAGCGGSNSASSGSGSSAKVLKVGSSIDFAPFEFQDEGQKEYQGFDMDLIRAIGKEMGYEVEIQNIGFDGLIPAMQAKNIDVIISGMTINDERKENVLFSDPYYQSGLTMVVRSDEQAIKSFQDLKGHKVAVQIGTTSAEAVKKLGGVEVKEHGHRPRKAFRIRQGPSRLTASWSSRATVSMPSSTTARSMTTTSRRAARRVSRHSKRS